MPEDAGASCAGAVTDDAGWRRSAVKTAEGDHCAPCSWAQIGVFYFLSMNAAGIQHFVSIRFWHPSGMGTKARACPLTPKGRSGPEAGPKLAGTLVHPPVAGLLPGCGAAKVQFFAWRCPLTGEGGELCCRSSP